jgi:hypothetical protein
MAFFKGACSVDICISIKLMYMYTMYTNEAQIFKKKKSNLVFCYYYFLQTFARVTDQRKEQIFFFIFLASL